MGAAETILAGGAMFRRRAKENPAETQRGGVPGQMLSVRGAGRPAGAAEVRFPTTPRSVARRAVFVASQSSLRHTARPMRTDEGRRGTYAPG